MSDTTAQTTIRTEREMAAFAAAAQVCTEIGDRLMKESDWLQKRGYNGRESACQAGVAYECKRAIEELADPPKPIEEVPG